MIDILPIGWYFESPIDYEHKQYVLLGYLLKVDSSFLEKQLSPHLLHLEKLTKELLEFENSFVDIKKKFDKNRYIYFSDNSMLVGEDNILIYEIKEIVDFSIPQIRTRIDLGYKILGKNSQVLY